MQYLVQDITANPEQEDENDNLDFEALKNVNQTIAAILRDCADDDDDALSPKSKPFNI